MVDNIVKTLTSRTNIERIIPGKSAVEGREYIYISDNGKNEFSKIFNTLTEQVKPRNATSGGAIVEGCKIWLPDNEGLFHAISYKGDVEGWRKDFELGAKALNLLIAKIKDNNIVISNEKSFNLSDCIIELD